MEILWLSHLVLVLNVAFKESVLKETFKEFAIVHVEGTEVSTVFIKNFIIKDSFTRIALFQRIYKGLCSENFGTVR